MCTDQRQVEARHADRGAVSFRVLHERKLLCRYEREVEAADSETWAVSPRVLSEWGILSGERCA